MLEYYYLSCYIHEDSEKSYCVVKFYAKRFCKAVFGVTQCDKHFDKHFFPPLRGLFIVISKWI